MQGLVAAQHGLSHICAPGLNGVRGICRVAFRSSADHGSVCPVVDGRESATAYAPLSKGGAAWLVNSHMGRFPAGGFAEFKGMAF